MPRSARRKLSQGVWRLVVSSVAAFVADNTGSPAMTNTTHYHAVVWLDHHEARVIHFDAETSNKETVHPADPPKHLHIKSGSASGTHLHGDPVFYRDVAAACDESTEVLLMGPSSAKTEFVHYLRQHWPTTFERISGVETSARLTDPQLLAEGRRFFATENRTVPQH